MNAAANRCADRLPANCSVPRLAVFLTLVTCIVLTSLTFDAEKVEGMLVWVQENKREGSVLFLVVYTAGVVLMFPAMVMAMAAGAVFGMVWGTLLVWVGSSVGQTLAFMVGRYLLRELVTSYLTRQFPKWTAIDKALEGEGWKLVTLLRLSPIAPWNVLNYALSVTAVPLAPYVAASSLAILPYLLLFVYFGSLARNLADIFTGHAGMGARTTLVFAAISGVLMVAVVAYTTHLSRKAISSALLASGGEQTAELAADPDVAELLRVNSGDVTAAAEHAGPSPGSARSSLQHGGGFGAAGSPRGGVELTAVLVGSGGKAGASPPPLPPEAQHLLAKKHTPAAVAERGTLLDRLPQHEGKVHQRASATGGPGGGTSPLGVVAAARSRPNGMSAV